MPSICSCRKPEPLPWIVATSTLPAFMCCTKPGPSSSRVPSPRCSSRLFGARIARPASFATRPSPWTASTPVRITPNFCGASASRTPSPARRWYHQQLLASGRHHLRALQKPLAGGTLLQVDQAASSDQAVLRHVIWSLRPRRHRQGASTWTPRSNFVTDPLGDPLRENGTCGRRMQRFANNQPIEFIRFLTGH